MTEQNPTRLRSDPDVGLTAQQVREQEARGLSNIQPSHNTKTVGQIVRDNTLTLFNLFNFALAACIALVGAYENLLFLIIIFVNSGVGIVQEIRSKRMVEKLSLISMPKAVALRDGREQAVPVEELVLDDILVLRMGGQICADAIVAAGEVEVNEALLTGEAEPIRKSRGDMLLSGSFVVSGACRARVEHIGSDNYATKIALDAKKYKKVHSDLMNALDKIVKFTSFFILPLGALLFLHARFVLDHSLEGAVVSTAAALIGMMPKGLVLLTSVSLAVGVIKLARKKTLVQELFCIENLSRVDMLCLDKTGTITQGKMTVSDILPLTAQPPFDLEEAVGSFIGALDDNNATFLALGGAVSRPGAVAGRLPHPLFLRPQMELCHLRGTGHRAGGRTGNFAAGTQRAAAAGGGRAGGRRLPGGAGGPQRGAGGGCAARHGAGRWPLWCWRIPSGPTPGRPWPFSPGRTYN